MYIRDTSIRVSKDTHSKLTEIAKKGESYNDVIEKLLSTYVEENPDVQ